MSIGTVVLGLLSGCARIEGLLSNYHMPDMENVLDSVESLTEADLANLQGVDAYETGVLENASSDRYYYKLLDEEARQIYGEILYILLNEKENIALSTTNLDLVDRAFNYVLMDYPEIFYVSGYNCLRYMVLGDLRSITFSGQYILEPEEVSWYRDQIEAYSDEFFKSLNEQYPEGIDDYNLVKFAYEYIVINTDYDLEAPLNQGIASVMVNHLSVCNGYAKALQFLLNRAGMECTLVTGTTTNATGHAWNLVKADGNYYYVDSTWGDGTFTVINNSGEDIEALPPISYDYLLVTEDELKMTHTFDNPELMPQCDCLEDNYYIRENLYFTEVNPEQLSMVFDRAYDNDEEYITLKMASDECYDELWTYLIKEQNIFDYLRDVDAVSYAQNKDRLFIGFWIK